MYVFDALNAAVVSAGMLGLIFGTKYMCRQILKKDCRRCGQS